MAGYCWPTPPPEIPRRSQASLAQSLAGSLLLSPRFWCAQGFVYTLQVKVLVLTLCYTVNSSSCGQAPLSIDFSRQECWSGWPFPSPGGRLDPGIEPRSPASQPDSVPREPPRKPTLIPPKANPTYLFGIHPHLLAPQRQYSRISSCLFPSWFSSFLNDSHHHANLI